MLLDAVGGYLPLALAVALSPFPLIATTLLLTGPRARVAGWLFLVGWVVGLSLLTAVALLLLGEAESTGTGSAVVAWARVVLGAVLVGLAVRKLLRRPAPADGEDPPVPGWMSAFDAPSGARTLGLGALLGGANPKNIALAASAAAGVQETAPDQAALAGALFVLLCSSAVLVAVVAHALLGARAEPALTTVRRVMTRHSTVLTAAVLLLIGAMILGDGLAAL